MDDGQAAERLRAEQDRLQEVRASLQEEGLRDQSEQEDLSELSSLDQHQADIGTETFNRERDLSILEQVEAELSDVEHALDRLAAGTYGTCEACGRPIDDARLEALPATRFCMADQTAAERETRAEPGG
ncbi:MAG TPA: TraR/DksA C4-type zinc finger protein [Acidimicrobiales bacterium]|nr:TraR/DksA C4-type zinc finger protein [Acidimicrobiales bacterium]